VTAPAARIGAARTDGGSWPSPLPAASEQYPRSRALALQTGRVCASGSPSRLLNYLQRLGVVVLRPLLSVVVLRPLRSLAGNCPGAFAGRRKASLAEPFLDPRSSSYWPRRVRPCPGNPIQPVLMRVDARLLWRDFDATLVCFGELTASGLEQLKRADASHVRSLLGEWILTRGRDVVVDDYCLSSCANHVLVAGNNERLLPGSLMAWQSATVQRVSTATTIRRNRGY